MITLETKYKEKHHGFARIFIQGIPVDTEHTFSNYGATLAGYIVELAFAGVAVSGAGPTAIARRKEKGEQDGYKPFRH